LAVAAPPQVAVLGYVFARRRRDRRQAAALALPDHRLKSTAPAVEHEQCQSGAIRRPTRITYVALVGKERAGGNRRRVDHPGTRESGAHVRRIAITAVVDTKSVASRGRQR